MTKYLQNKIAGSRITLPVACLYSFVVWLASGVIQEKWWLQLSCFAFTTYLMAILNSKNSLIRVYSSLISVFFMVFTCCNCLLFPSIREAVSILFLVLCYFILFSSYQDKTATGLTLYGFAALGAATMSNVHLLYYVPLFWLFMRYNLLSLSWRTWMASVLGLLLPYWFVASWYIYNNELQVLLEHFQPLVTFGPIADFSSLSTGQMALLFMIAVLGIIGTFHFLHKSYLDSIRVRLFYFIFLWTNLLTATFLTLQPQHYDLLIRVMMVNTAPLVAHFFALTATRITNIVFYATLVSIISLTVYHLWSTSLPF